MARHETHAANPGVDLLTAAAQVIISIAIVGVIFTGYLSMVFSNAAELDPTLAHPVLLPAAIGTVAVSVAACSLLAVVVTLRRVARERA